MRPVVRKLCAVLWLAAVLVTSSKPGISAQTTQTQLTSVSASATTVTAGLPVVFTAAASGGTGAYEYRFDLYDAAHGSWTLLQNYSTTATVTWTPSATGTFWVQVWVRAVGSASAWEDWRNSDVVTVSSPNPVRLTTYTTSGTSVTSSTPVVFTAAANGGTGAYEYRFDLYDAAHGTWTLLQNYSTTATVTWTPAAAGTYWVQVWVRAVGSSSAWDDWRNSEVIAVSSPSPVRLTTFTTSGTSVTSSPPVVFTAAASGGTGAYEYRFDLYDAVHETWTPLQNYSTNATISWTPDAAGTYWAQVWVRAVGSSSAWDDWRNSEVVTVAPPAVIPVRLTTYTTSSTITTTYTPVVLTAAANGGTGAYEYRFDLYDAVHGTWTPLQHYSTNATITWTPNAAGTYWVQVWVRAVGSSSTWEDWRNSDVITVSFAPPPPVRLSTVTASHTSTTVQGEMLFTAQATGGLGTYEYRFDLYDARKESWTMLQDYATSAAVTWTPSIGGTYWVQVWVRAVGSSNAWDDWRNTEELSVSDAWAVVRTVSGENVLTWSSVEDAGAYMIVEADNRASLTGPPPATGTATVAAPPYVSSTPAGAAPRYFRVFPVVSGVVHEGGPAAVSTAVTAHAVDTPPTLGGAGGTGEESAGDVTPALWDIDGDGCLDMIGRTGNCDGTFTASGLDPLGAGLLFQSGRINRDSRFADFNGDGIVDIFTNVYSPADLASSRAILLVGQPDGTFREDAGIAALGIGGFGETVVAADFDNDGDIDLYLPHYFAAGDGAHSWLLVNDGHGSFHDASATAGVSTTEPFNPEGAQALDFNQDGWVDILVATHLYINNGNLTFTDQSAAVNLPAVFDEGTLLFDADLDGDLDLVHHDAAVTRLYLNDNGRFDAGTTLTGAYGQNFGFGLNVCDVNGDGYQDVIVARNDLTNLTAAPQLLLNGGGTFAPSELSTLPAGYVDLIACADLDNSGLPDIVARSAVGNDHFQSLVNKASSSDAIGITVLGADGARNQQGHAIRVTPASAPSHVMLRFVESGSAYMAQNGYDLLVAAPWVGDYEVSVLFGSGWFTTTAHAGEHLTIYEGGTVTVGSR